MKTAQGLVCYPIPPSLNPPSNILNVLWKPQGPDVGSPIINQATVSNPPPLQKFPSLCSKLRVMVERPTVKCVPERGSYPCVTMCYHRLDNLLWPNLVKRYQYNINTTMANFSTVFNRIQMISKRCPIIVSGHMILSVQFQPPLHVIVYYRGAVIGQEHHVTWYHQTSFRYFILIMFEKRWTSLPFNFGIDIVLISLD